MSLSRTALLISALVGMTGMEFTTSVTAQDATKPCTSSAHRQFDFWVGDWTVRGSKSKNTATNHITREHGGCVVHEHYQTSRGYSGESLNIYDATRKVWHQTWVDSDGLLLLLEGGLRNGSMVLEGQTTDAGKLTKQRIAWTPNADGSVRQLWESTDDQGVWTVVFDGLYTRK